MTRLTTEKGVYVAGESHTLALPRGYKRDQSKIGVVFCHGAGELAPTMWQGSLPSKAAESALLAAIADVYPSISFDSGVWAAGNTTDSNHWGNAQSVTRLGQAITLLQSTAASGGGAKAGKVILIGLSMGHAQAINYAAANPNNVAAIVGVLPVNDLNDIRDNDRGGYRASISSAFGTGAWTAPGTPALGAPGNPAANASSITAIPHRLYYATGDAICTPATATALQATIGAKCSSVTIGAGGHSDASLALVDPGDLLSWLGANGG